MIPIQVGNWVIYRNKYDISASKGIVRWFDADYVIVEENEYSVEKLERKYIKAIVDKDTEVTDDYDMKKIGNIYYVSE